MKNYLASLITSFLIFSLNAYADTSKPETLNGELNMSQRDFDILNTYLLNERQTAVDLYNRKRQDLINRANAAGNAGNVARANEIMDQIDQLDLGINGTLKSIDNKLWKAHGDKASQEFMFTGNPARMQSVWSHYTGNQMQIQPRSDGMYNIYVNGQPALDDKGQFIVRDRTSLVQDFYRSIGEIGQDQQIIQNIISESIANYSGNCPCPYNIASNGSSCGQRSAYSNVGGYAPVCYASDVTPAMISAYKHKHGIRK